MPLLGAYRRARWVACYGELRRISLFMRTWVIRARDAASGARWPQRAGRGRALAEGSEPRG